MNDDELFAYLDAKAAYMKQYKRPLSAYKAKNFAANATAVQYQKEGTSKLDENFPSIEKINKQAEQDYKEGLKKIVEKKSMAKGGKTSVSPLKDRIIGSKKNKPGSASTKTSAQKIELNDSIVEALSEKAKEYNKKHSSKVSTNALKAVMRRGMGAFSSSHRPGMTRQGWGYARVNKFLLKKGGTKVKATYTQDDDLLENGGELKKEMKVSEQPKFKKLQQLEDKILHSRNRARNFMDWNEGSIGTNYNIKWQKMIKKLRGWDDNSSTSEQINNTKQEWKEYCKEVGAVENYNFGDVIA